MNIYFSNLYEFNEFSYVYHPIYDCFCFGDLHMFPCVPKYFPIEKLPKILAA